MGGTTLTKAQMLEQYAGTLSMTRKEVYQFCLTTLAKQGDDEGGPETDYLNETLYNDGFFVEKFFQEQAWDLPSAVNFFTSCINFCVDNWREWDT